MVQQYTQQGKLCKRAIFVCVWGEVGAIVGMCGNWAGIQYHTQRMAEETGTSGTGRAYSITRNAWHKKLVRVVTGRAYSTQRRA